MNRLWESGSRGKAGYWMRRHRVCSLRAPLAFVPVDFAKEVGRGSKQDGLIDPRRWTLPHLTTSTRRMPAARAISIGKTSVTGTPGASGVAHWRSARGRPEVW